MSRRRTGGVKALVGLGVAAFVGTCGVATAQTSSPVGTRTALLYKDPAQSVEARVEDLLKRMTLEEKAAQLMTLWEQKAKVQTDAEVSRLKRLRETFPTALVNSRDRPTSAA